MAIEEEPECNQRTPAIGIAKKGRLTEAYIKP
jgi:hypothetical protein